MGFGRLGKFSCGDCEKNWILGSSGICNVTTSTCVCPEGYSGRDDLVITQTCHVHDNSVVIAQQVAFFLLLCSLLVTLNALFKSISKLRLQSSEEYDIVLSLTTKAQFFGVMSLACFTGVFGLHGFSGEKVSHVNYRYILPNLAGFGVIFLSLSFNLTLYSWYISLPEPRQFGALLNTSPFIVQHHSKIVALFILNGVSWCVVSFVCFIILPLFDNEDNFNQTTTSILLFYFPVGLVIYLCLAITTSKSLVDLYESALKVMTKIDDAAIYTVNYHLIKAQQTNLKNILKVLFYIRILSIGSLFFCLGFLGAIIGTGGLYQYIFLSGAQFLFSLTSTLSMVITLRRTSGGMRIRQSKTVSCGNSVEV